MGRFRNVGAQFKTPHFLVVWDLQWQVLVCDRLEGGVDLRGALERKIDELQGQGWQRENKSDFSFVFLRHQDQRRLVTVTPRDPYNTAWQTFSPFDALEPGSSAKTP